MEKWWSIKEAAKFLGVHPTTLRSWTKKGLIPFHITSGGHRRFLEEELRLWSEAHRGVSSPDNVITFSLKNARAQITEANLSSQEWYQKLDERAREIYRRAGAYLLESMHKCILNSEEENRIEAQAIGHEYASRALRYNLDELNTLRAFFFFRYIAINAISQTYKDLLLKSVDVLDQIHKMIQFTDEIMVALVETYHQLSAASKPEGNSSG